MLFDSYIFLFAFLPITLLVYFFLTRSKFFTAAIAWLVAASLFFYGWWNPKYLILIIASLIINYLFGVTIIQRAKLKATTKVYLILGVVFNLSLIGVYKYANFFVDNFSVNGMSYHLEPIILPLAISFFTFQQIGFLVDASQGDIKQNRFLDYCLFITFFPQLIAGPIVQYKQMMPQLSRISVININLSNINIGLTIFFIGLLKKIGLADSVSVYANCIFDAASRGVLISFWEAWLGAISYSLQLYFDFSGYSDMAIGLAFLFGIKLPINFNSPYKATNIIQFWRCWHITLSHFLRDYLYIPLGGNRRGKIRSYVHILITMLLGGLWHGANWTFVLWGGIHGIFIFLNHFWRWLVSRIKLMSWAKHERCKPFYHILTLIIIVTAWVIFRSDTIKISQSILHAMYSLEYFSLPSRLVLNSTLLQNLGIECKGMVYNGLADWYMGLMWIVPLIFVALFGPNTLQIMRRYYDSEAEINKNRNIINLVWHPSTKWASIMALVMLISVMLMSGQSEFLYFQF